MADTETAAPETQESPVAEAAVVTDALGAYESFTVPNPDAQEESAETGTTEEAPAEETTEAPSDESAEAKEVAEQDKPAEEFTDSELELLNRALSPRGKEGLPQAVRQRLDQLTDNTYGNRLQQERAKIEQQVREQVERETKQRDDDAKLYDALSNDDQFYEQMVQKHGRPTVMRWIANHEQAMQQSQQGPSQQQQVERLNQGFIQQFQEIATNALPHFSELPDDVQQAVQNVKYDPNGNWFADAMEAIGKGYDRHIKSMERAHKEELEQARQAGQNEAIANSDNTGPVQMQGQNGNNFTSFRQVENAFANGAIGWEEFQRQKSIFGVDF